MGVTKTTYKIIAGALGPLMVAGSAARGRFGGRWRERFGLADFSAPDPARPRLWLHAASVGESRVAAAIIEELLKARRELDIYLSVGTPAGLAAAADMFKGGRVRLSAPPFDFWGAPGRFLRRLKPRALVIVETELWPTLIEETRRRNIKLILAAGRLTARSFGRYLKVKKFMAELLGCFDLLAVAGEAEEERFLGLGAPKERVRVLGTPKYDGLLERSAGPDFEAELAALGQKLWGDAARPPMIVAGSTHRGEEAAVIAAYEILRETYPDLVLALAPRHLGRTPEIAREAASRGLSVSLFSGRGRPLLNGPGVLVLDEMGQLARLYALASAALVGGSLFGGHGHNPLEPAAVGAPIIFGPYMDSFASESQSLLAAEGAVELPPAGRGEMPRLLAEAFGRFLGSPSAREVFTKAARRCLAERPAASPAQARAILALITPEEFL